MALSHSTVADRQLRQKMKAAATAFADFSPRAVSLARRTSVLTRRNRQFALLGRAWAGQHQERALAWRAWAAQHRELAVAWRDCVFSDGGLSRLRLVLMQVLTTQRGRFSSGLAAWQADARPWAAAVRALLKSARTSARTTGLDLWHARATLQSYERAVRPYVVAVVVALAIGWLVGTN